MRNVRKRTLLPRNQRRNLNKKWMPAPNSSILGKKSQSMRAWWKKWPYLTLCRVTFPLASSDWWHWKTASTWSNGMRKKASKYWALNRQAKKNNKSTRISKWRSRIWINYSRRSLNNTKTSTINKWRKNWRRGKVRRPRGRPDRPQTDWLFTCKT